MPSSSRPARSAARPVPGIPVAGPAALTPLEATLKILSEPTSLADGHEAPAPIRTESVKDGRGLPHR